MRFELLDEFTIAVKDRDVELIFNVSKLRRSNLVEADKDLFREINDYIGTLDHQTQAAIFNIYKEIREMRDDVVSVSFNVQQKETTHLVKRLYELLDFKEMQIYIAKNRHQIRYPTNLVSKNNVKENVNHNVNINYFDDEYDGLVFLVFALRPMVPIWGEYIDINKDAAGSKHSEFQAFRLLEHSALNDCPQLERLRLYISEWRSTVSNRDILPSNTGVLDGISSDSLTNYLLAVMLVRKVSITNINATDSGSSIITNIYSYLKSKINEAAKHFDIRPKYNETDVTEEGDETSKLEKYKISTKLTYGDIQFIKSYVGEPTVVAKHLIPDLDLSILESCMEANNNRSLPFHKIQLKLLQWVISPVFPTDGIYELNKTELSNLFSVAQAALFHWDLPMLALILTADIDSSQMPILVNTRTGIDSALIKQLDKLYPYKEQTKSGTRRHNVAYEPILDTANDLLNKFYRVYPPAHYQTNENLTHGVSAPLDTANQLATMVLKVNGVYEPI